MQALQLCLTIGRELPAQAFPALVCSESSHKPPQAKGTGLACQILCALRFAKKLTRLANERKPICFLSVIPTSGIRQEKGELAAQPGGRESGCPRRWGCSESPHQGQWGAELLPPLPRHLVASPCCGWGCGPLLPPTVLHKGCCTQHPSAGTEPQSLHLPPVSSKDPNPSPCTPLLA